MPAYRGGLGFSLPITRSWFPSVSGPKAGINRHYSDSTNLQQADLSSGDDLADGFAEVDLQALVAGHFQLPRVEAELVQDGGVDVGDVVTVLGGMEADLIGGAVDDAALDAAAGQPHAEAVGVMIAA